MANVCRVLIHIKFVVGGEVELDRNTHRCAATSPHSSPAELPCSIILSSSPHPCFFSSLLLLLKITTQGHDVMLTSYTAMGTETLSTQNRLNIRSSFCFRCFKLWSHTLLYSLLQRSSLYSSIWLKYSLLLLWWHAHKPVQTSKHSTVDHSLVD